MGKEGLRDPRARKRTLPLWSVLLGSAVALILIVVTIALVPVSVYWVSSLGELSGIASSTADSQLSLYRTLIIKRVCFCCFVFRG